MDEWLVNAKVGFHGMCFIVEADTFEKALTKARRYVTMLSNDINISDLSVKKLYAPCPFCMTEMIDMYGCPNIGCIGKKIKSRV